MARWYCGRCAVKLGKSVDSDPSLIRVCDGCGIKNYCNCETESKVGEEGESNPLTKEELETPHVAFEEIEEIEAVIEKLALEQTEREVKEILEVQSEDVVVSEEVVQTAEPPTDGDAITYELDPEKTEVIVTIKPEMREVVEENVTATLEEQIAALRAKIDAYEAEKE